VRVGPQRPTRGLRVGVKLAPSDSCGARLDEGRATAEVNRCRLVGVGASYRRLIVPACGLPEIDAAGEKLATRSPTVGRFAQAPVDSPVAAVESDGRGDPVGGQARRRGSARAVTSVCVKVGFAAVRRSVVYEAASSLSTITGRGGRAGLRTAASTPRPTPWGEPTFTQTLITAPPTRAASWPPTGSPRPSLSHAATRRVERALAQIDRRWRDLVPFLAGGVNFCNPQCWYDIAIDVHPTKPRHRQPRRLAHPRPGALDERRRELQPQPADRGRLHVDSHALAIAKSDRTSSISAVTAASTARTTPGSPGRRSTSRTSRHPVQSLATHPSDGELMIGGTQDNGTILRRPDGTWYRATGATAATR